MSLSGHVQNGVVVLDSGASLPEGTKVTVAALPHQPAEEATPPVLAFITPPTVTDPVERQRILNEVVQRMMANPIPENAPKFTRDDLHERR